MRILSLTHVGADELLTTLRRTRLRGHGGAQPYADASLDLVAGVDPWALTPAQNYVLEPGVATVIALRDAVLDAGVDILALDGGLHVVTDADPAERVPVLPPIVEESVEPDGRTVLLVNDGMHRLVAALRLGVRVSVVIVRGVPAEYPYYAFPLPGGWSEVTALPEIPGGHQKKRYRRPDDYKALFRQFGDLFPGVQSERPRAGSPVTRRSEEAMPW